jgi:hypothetical protein
MTSLLDSAFQRAKTLPEHLQDELAQQLIADIENELQWQQTLAREQSSVLDELAQQALTESMRGETQLMGFEEL